MARYSLFVLKVCR